jgi:hypothetical protein
MPNTISIHSPSVSPNGDAIHFAIVADGESGRGEASRSLLDYLASEEIGTPLDVFHRHLERIEELVAGKWLGPSEPVRLCTADA